MYHEMVVEKRTGKPGRPRGPRAVVHDDLDYATVHKTREKGQVVKVEQKVIYGNSDRISKRLENSPSQTINTSYVERANGTLRQMDAHLHRKSLTFAKNDRYFDAKLYLVIALYDFVRPHWSLSKNTDKSWMARTPAMAAKLADRPWAISELTELPQIMQ